ncbi:MAG: hypothetical protein GY820_04290, partial [Gammaproteobacteria bacterium]|nr:hypothetical protein [Gammaproteobacteria bacterium]
MLEITADMYLLAYISTKGHYIPTAIMKKAEWLRLYYAQQPQVWLLGVSQPSDPQKLEDQLLPNSLFQATRQTLKEVFCVLSNGTHDYSTFHNQRNFKDPDFPGLPFHLRFGRSTQKRDNQSQAEFDAEWAVENVDWNPPEKIRNISPQAESDFYSQLKDKTAYSELVCEGQKDGETDREFMTRLRSMTLTKEEYRVSPKRVFQFFPDDKNDDDDQSKVPQGAQAKAKQSTVPTQPQSVPQSSQQQTSSVPPKQVQKTVPQGNQQQSASVPQKQVQKVVSQGPVKKVTQSRPLTGAAYHMKVIRQMLHYFGSVWTGISDARHNYAYSIDQTIREDPMTNEEKEKLESTPSRYILPPQELFYPTDSPSERTDWWCEITAQAILEATTDTNRSAEKYSK